MPILLRYSALAVHFTKRHQIHQGQPRNYPLSGNPKILCRLHNTLQLEPELSHMNFAYTLQIYILKIHLNIIG
jgi:hypothetical protein